MSSKNDYNFILQFKKAFHLKIDDLETSKTKILGIFKINYSTILIFFLKIILKYLQYNYN